MKKKTEQSSNSWNVFFEANKHWKRIKEFKIKNNLHRSTWYRKAFWRVFSPLITKIAMKKHKLWMKKIKKPTNPKLCIHSKLIENKFHYWKKHTLRRKCPICHTFLIDYKTYNMFMKEYGQFIQNHSSFEIIQWHFKYWLDRNMIKEEEASIFFIHRNTCPHCKKGYVYRFYKNTYKCENCGVIVLKQ